MSEKENQSSIFKKNEREFISRANGVPAEVALGLRKRLVSNGDEKVAAGATGMAQCYRRELC